MLVCTINNITMGKRTYGYFITVKMKLVQLCLLYTWMCGCYCESLCKSKCYCQATLPHSKLDCSGKSLISFPQLFEIPYSVEEIILKNNQIKHLPYGEAEIGQLPNVWAIGIPGNKIIDVDDNIFQHMFPNLRYLDLSRNQIKKIKHKTFIGLKLLTSLDLGSNQISYISKKAFDHLSNLTDLSLNKNQLKELDFLWFRNLKSLMYLHLGDNIIETVKSWTQPWPITLKRVSLNNNKIQVILPIPKHAEMLNLEGNPIYCGCRPKRFFLNDIPILTLCKVRIQCNSIKLKGTCNNEQLSEEVYKFWKDIAGKPICQVPVIKQFKCEKNPERLHYLTCVATGMPIPNIRLYSSDSDRKIQVFGKERNNFSSVIVSQLHSGTYHCEAANIVSKVTQDFEVDLNEFEISGGCKSRDSNLNLTSEVPFLNVDSLTEVSISESNSRLVPTFVAIPLIIVAVPVFFIIWRIRRCNRQRIENVVSTTEEPPFIMHHLSPADDEVPGTSRGDNPYEEIKDEDLGLIYSVPLTEEEIFAQVMAVVNRHLRRTMRMPPRKGKSLGKTVIRKLIDEYLEPVPAEDTESDSGKFVLRHGKKSSTSKSKYEKPKNPNVEMSSPGTSMRPQSVILEEINEALQQILVEQVSTDSSQEEDATA